MTMPESTGQWRNRIVGHGEESAEQLLANPANWRIHPKAQQDALAGVLSEVGWVQSVIVNRRTGFVVDGHLRVALAITRGEKVPVVYVDLSEEEEALILATLDPLSALAVADKAQLDALLREVSTGDAAVQAMLAELAEDSGLDYGKPTVEDPGAQIDRAEELREKWQTECGQIWIIGKHRLMCGDSTKAEDVARLMGGERAEMSVTSPPYGVGKEYETGGIIPWRRLISAVILNIVAHSAFCVWNIADLFCTGGQKMEHTFGESVGFFANQGWPLFWLRIWKKPGIVMDGSPYWTVTYKPGDEYEFIGGFGAKDTKFVQRLTDQERHDWAMRGIWEFASVHANRNHAAMYPIELPIRAIKMHSDQAGLVLDLFLGSGTTMVAAEQLGRLCYGMEIEPKYVAVALERMAGMGLEPRLK